MARGDHIWVPCAGYTHHGIDAGDGHVIHFIGTDKTKELAEVRRTPIAEFGPPGEIRVQQYASGATYPPDEVVRRAASQIGKRGYNLLTNNCEVLAKWAKTGDPSSEQALRAMSAALGVGATVAGATAAVGLAGAVGMAGLSGGAQLMSGLATVGGGSSAFGAVALGAVPTAAAVYIFQQAMRDDPTQTAQERRARQIARRTAAGAGVGSVLLALAALYYAGSRVGLSAAGITSGLNAVGSVAGGGMGAGIGVVGVGMSLASVAAGWAAYNHAGGDQPMPRLLGFEGAAPLAPEFG